MGGRDRFWEPEGRFLPPPIPAFENLLSELHRRPQPRTDLEPLVLYFFPDPAMLVDGGDASRQDTYLRQYVHMLPAMRSRVLSGGGPLRSQQWRDLLRLARRTTQWAIQWAANARRKGKGRCREVD
jgi:hypothetical protein